MPKLHVFACPSCGASLSVDGDAATTKCQFCGNTVIVPEEMRGKAEAEATPSTAGLAQGAPLKELGNLIRAGNKLAAIKLYRELFGGGLAEAQSAVDRLALGQGVPVVYMGMPTTLLVDRSPTASMGGPTFVPTVQTVQPMQTVQPVIVTGNPGRSLGCVLWSVFIITGLGILLSVLAATGAMLPLFATLFGSDLPFGLGEALTSVPSVGATLAAATPAPASTAVPTPGFASAVLAFGEEGTGGGTFHDPRHVAVDGEGNIYVGEWEEHRVQVFDSSGDFVTQWSAGENDAILVSMAADRNGAVFAVAGGRLYYYDGASGELLGEIEYEGNNNFEDVVVTADGGLVAAWGSAASDNLVRFDHDFEPDLFIPTAVSAVTGDSELDMKAAVDGNGEIFVLGTFNQAVFRFSPEGVFRNQFGSTGDEPGQFRGPLDIAVDHQSRIYVSDFKGIQVFDASGRYLDTFDVPDGGVVFGMVVDDDNFLYAVSNNSKVYKFQLND
jgi:streptogramin lyase